MADRLPCTTPGCASSILPSTAAATGGICMPCANRARADAHARYVAAHRVDLDRYAGVTDPVEILRLIHNPPARDPLTRDVPFETSTANVYRSLTQADADRLVETAAPLPSFRHDVASHLACFGTVGLTACQRTLVASGDPYPAHAFRTANDAVVDSLFALLTQSVDKNDRSLLNHTLSALAWARSPRVVDSMVEWARRPPPWRDTLHIAPAEYASVAGFEIVEDAVRDLTLPVSRRVVPAARGTGGAPNVSLFEHAVGGAPCPRCSRRGRFLLRFDSDALTGAFDGVLPKAVPTCLDCAPDDVVFVRLEDSGAWQWLPGVAAASAAEGDGWALQPERATLVARPAWEAIDWCIADGLSQIGGHPSWITDPSYPPCPECSRSMPTVAQVGLDDFSTSAEGIFYVHQCARCAVLGVSYQQT